MPPKMIPRGRKSQQPASELILIYDILTDKQNDDAVRTVFKKLEALLKQDTSLVQKSFLIFVLKICGLDSCIQKINWREPINSLTDLLQQMCQQNQKSIFLSELFLVNLKSKFHKQFISRLSKLLQIVVSDQISLLTETQILKLMYQALTVISKCKMRNIRHCSIVMANLMIKRMKSFYDQLTQSKSTKRASKLMNLIDEGYLDNIIRPRLKDIDAQIRQKAFQIMGQTMLSCSHQILNIKKLQELYTQNLKENKTKITQLCLQSVIKLYDVEKQKIGINATKNLTLYAAQVTKQLQQLALLPNRNSYLAMDALISIHEFDSNLNTLKPKIIAKIFQIHGYQKYQPGLTKAVSLFFKSLIRFSSSQQLIQHRSVLMTQITHLLCSINSSKILSTILQQFFKSYPVLFAFDEMFLLLFTEYYHRDGSDIELQENQLNVICTMISEFNIFLRNNKSYANVQKQYSSYNKNILTNCKQIYYQKISKHPSLAYLYLRLFSNLYLPIQGNIQNYLSFVEQKTLDMIRQQKYISISSDNIVQIQQIIHQCCAILRIVYQQNLKFDPIIKHFRVFDLIGNQKLNDIQIIKLAAISSNFNIPQIINEGVMRKLIDSYNRSYDKVIKLQALLYCYHAHKSMFKQLFNSPSQSKYTQYISLRTGYMQFLLKIVLGSSSQDSLVKLGAFNIICQTLKLISNSKITDLPSIYYQPSISQMEILYDFVGEYIHFNQEPNVSETSMMMASVSLQSSDARQQILVNIFQLFAQSYRLSLNKLSTKFLTKFIIANNNSIFKSVSRYLDNFINQLIKSEISNQYSNRFVFWRVFIQILVELGIQDQENSNKIIGKFVDSYYKFRKGHAQTKSLLSNKLMLFVADSIDKYINNQNMEGLNIVKTLLSKTYRRFPKQTLQRLLIFFNSKITQIQDDKNVKKMKDFLTKISKTANKKQSKNEQKQQSQQQSQQQKMEQKDQGNQSDQQNLDRSNTRHVRIQKTPNNQLKDQRATRSKNKVTKKKN